MPWPQPRVMRTLPAIKRPKGMPEGSGSIEITDMLAARMQGALGSTIRELTKLAGRGDVISFAGGLPAPDLFDQEGIRAATQEVLDEHLTSALQYGPTEGLGGLRVAVTELMLGRGLRVGTEQVIVTSGAQQGLDLLGKVLLDPGDTVIVESPTYLAALQTFRLYQARLVGVPVEADGLDLAALEASFQAMPRPKLLYTVPSFGNPTGVMMSVAKRLEVLRLAARYQVLVVEDDPYSELRFSGAAPTPLLALADQVDGAANWTVYLSSLSKIVSPGLRVGWLALPKALHAKVTIAKQSVDLHTSSFTQALALAYLRSGRLVERIPLIRASYRARAAAMMSALPRHAPGLMSFEEPQGGMFLWARLPEGVAAAALAVEAARAGVLFVPGAPFYADNADPRALRLSFSSASPAEIDEGVQRLARAWASYNKTRQVREST